MEPSSRYHSYRQSAYPILRYPKQPLTLELVSLARKDAYNSNLPILAKHIHCGMHFPVNITFEIFQGQYDLMICSLPVIYCISFA